MIVHTEGIDFIGPEPSVLTFTSGQSIGDNQCATVTIVDDSVLRGQRYFRIRLVNITNYSDYSRGVHVYIGFGMPSVDIRIAADTDDGIGI